MTDVIHIDETVTKKFSLLVTTLASFLSPFGLSSVNVALPSIGKEFQMDAILLSWVTTAYLLATSAFLVPIGRTADMYGRKRILAYGLLIFTLASAGCALSNSTPMLLGLRVLQGIGAAAVYPVAAAIVTSVFPSRELGRVFGINLTAVYTGYSVGPFLGGFLTQHLGWRSIFFVNILLGSTILVLILWKLKGEWLERGAKKFDLPGSIIYCVALLLIIYGFAHLSTMLGVWIFLSGVLGILAFVKWETKIESPLLNLNLFKNNRVFALSNLATLTIHCATFAVTFLLSLYLQYIKKLTPESAGLVLLSQPVIQALFSPFAGRLSDRIEPRIVASIGMALTVGGLILLAFLTEKTTLGFTATALGVLGLGYAFFSSPNANAVMSSVEGRFYGVASGTLSTMRMMGMAFSMGITVLIFSIYIGQVQITPEYYPAFMRCQKLGFTFFAVLCFGGLFASLARGKVR